MWAWPAHDLTFYRTQRGLSGDAVAKLLNCARSRSHQQFLRSTPDNNPVRYARAVRRGSTRVNRPAIRPIKYTNSACHRPTATPSSAATTRSSHVFTNTR
jgi:hypothetical protein